MDVALFRALADFLKTELLTLGDTVHCFIDEEANRKGKFPAIYFVDLDETRKSLGCGRVDYTKKNLQGSVIENGKLYNYEAMIRFQVEAPSDDQRQGSEIVADLAKKIDHLFVKTSKTLSKVEFIDPKSSQALSLDGEGYAKGSAAGVFNTDVTMVDTRIKFDFDITDATEWPFDYNPIFDSSLVGRYFIGLVREPASLSVFTEAGVKITVSHDNLIANWLNDEFNTVKVKFKNEEFEVWINEVSVATSAITFTPGNPVDIYIGGFFDGSRKWSGDIDYLRIYSDEAMNVPTAKWEFDGDYKSSVNPVNDLIEQGSGNLFIYLDAVLITGIFSQGMTTIPPDIGGKPIIYRRALTYKFVYQWAFEQDVDHTFERVLVSYPETAP